MHKDLNPHEEVRLPDSAQGCRERMATLQGEIASIRTQIATTDIRRQLEKKTLDPDWFHRAKTALRIKQQELAQVTTRLAGLNEQPIVNRREVFKDALIDVVRAQCDDEQWSSLLTRARALSETQGAHHG